MSPRPNSTHYVRIVVGPSSWLLGPTTPARAEDTAQTFRAIVNRYGITRFDSVEIIDISEAISAYYYVDSVPVVDAP